jgi:hypothetical protein
MYQDRYTTPLLRLREEEIGAGLSPVQSVSSANLPCEESMPRHRRARSGEGHRAREVLALNPREREARAHVAERRWAGLSAFKITDRLDLPGRIDAEQVLGRRWGPRRGRTRGTRARRVAFAQGKSGLPSPLKFGDTLVQATRDSGRQREEWRGRHDRPRKFHVLRAGSRRWGVAPHEVVPAVAVEVRHTLDLPTGVDHRRRTASDEYAMPVHEPEVGSRRCSVFPPSGCPACHRVEVVGPRHLEEPVPPA